MGIKANDSGQNAVTGWGRKTLGLSWGFISRRLFTLNTGHAITAYFGYLKGYETIEESIKDEVIYDFVKRQWLKVEKD